MRENAQLQPSDPHSCSGAQLAAQACNLLPACTQADTVCDCWTLSDQAGKRQQHSAHSASAAHGPVHAWASRRLLVARRRMQTPGRLRVAPPPGCPPRAQPGCAGPTMAGPTAGACLRSVGCNVREGPAHARQDGAQHACVHVRCLHSTRALSPVQEHGRLAVDSAGPPQAGAAATDMQHCCQAAARYPGTCTRSAATASHQC